MNESYKKILELGLQFVESALDELTDGAFTGLELHAGLLHLFTGTELIVKARLVKEHWSLIFEEINSASREAYTEGDYRSAQFADSVQRLTKVVGCEISEREKRALTGLRNRRNRLVHSGLVDTEQGIKASTADVLVFLLRFIKSEFSQLDEKSLIDSYLESFADSCQRFQEYLDRQFAGIASDIVQLRKTKTVVRCCVCKKESAVINEGRISCLCCNDLSDDPRYSMSVNRESPPDEFGSCRVEYENGCCAGMVLSFEECDAEGVPGRKTFICFVCGKTGGYEEFYGVHH